MRNLLTAFVFLAAAASPQAAPALPLKVSENRRHLVDQRGPAFLYNADTPWMLFLKLTEVEAKEYITRRKEQGFTALQAQLTIDLSKVSGAHVAASWFNPRTGESTSIGEITDKKRRAFEPPGDGDWVLVLEGMNR